MTHTEAGVHTPTSASTHAQTRVPVHTHTHADTHTSAHTQADTQAPAQVRTRKRLVLREPDAVGGPSGPKRGSHITIVVDGLFHRYVFSIYRKRENEYGYGPTNLMVGERKFTRTEVIKRRKEEYLKAKYGRS